jgi:hypothetical protein
MLQTVNDVLVGVTYAALSRYYFRKSGDVLASYSVALNTVTYLLALKLNSDRALLVFPVFISGESDKEIRVRSILLVNLRPTTSLHVRQYEFIFLQ